MISVQKGDYLIGRSEKKTLLFKAESLHKGVVTGTIEKDAHIKLKRFTAEIPVKDLIMNLGTDPHPGKVYGHDVGSLYRGRKTHPEFGPLFWFYKPEAEVGAQVTKAFDKVWKVLKQNRLDFVVQPLSCIWEIMPYTGELYSGMYKRSRDTEKSPHRLQIKPETLPASEWNYVLYHELGHHLHSEFMTSKKLNAQWVQLFNSTIAVRQIKREKSQELLDNLLAQEDPPSAYKANLSEEDTDIYKLILSYIKREHNVSVKELDILFEADYKDEIRGVWPLRGIAKKDLAPVVSAYACRSWRELFAEAFAFRMVGRKLPKAVESLLDKSLSYARTNNETQG
jgi:hypothetical protein